MVNSVAVTDTPSPGDGQQLDEAGNVSDHSWDTFVTLAANETYPMGVELHSLPAGYPILDNLILAKVKT